MKSQMLVCAWSFLFIRHSIRQTDRSAWRHPPGMLLMMSMMRTPTGIRIVVSPSSVFLYFWMRMRKRRQSLVRSCELTHRMFWNSLDNRNRIWDFTLRWIVAPDVAASYLNTRRSHFHLWFSSTGCSPYIWTNTLFFCPHWPLPWNNNFSPTLKAWACADRAEGSASIGVKFFSKVVLTKFQVTFGQHQHWTEGVPGAKSTVKCLWPWLFKFMFNFTFSFHRNKVNLQKNSLNIRVKLFFCNLWVKLQWKKF